MVEGVSREPEEADESGEIFTLQPKVGLTYRRSHTFV